MALPKFWLINGSKKKGKKSVKKVAKRIAKKVAKKSVVRKSRPAKTKTIVKKEVVYRAIPTNTIPTSIMTEQEKIKYNRGNNTMAKRRKAKRSVAKATRTVAKSKSLARPKISIGRHRITTFYNGGVLKTSRKSKIAKRNQVLKTNPFKLKGIVKTLQPAVVLSATSVGTMFGLNKVMPKLPYVNTITNSYIKAGVKVALGLIGQMGIKKVVKNDNIANGILIGAIISALTDFVNIGENKTVNGIKVLGSPLSFGRPKTVLGNPNFQMNGIKIPANTNLQAIKFPKNYNAPETVSGCAERW